MFNFLASQIPGPIFCTPASLGHASVTGMSIGNLQYILHHDLHNLLCDLILKHEPEFVWGFQCSLLGSKIHYLGQEKSNSLHGSTQVVNIHYLGQIHNLGQNIHNGTHVSAQMENKTLKGGIECDRGWERNKNIRNSI